MPSAENRGHLPAIAHGVAHAGQFDVDRRRALIRRLAQLFDVRRDHERVVVASAVVIDRIDSDEVVEARR